MSGIKLDRVEEEGMLERQRSGAVLITVAKVLLWMDFLLLAFVYVGLRAAPISGSGGSSAKAFSVFCCWKSDPENAAA